ncbi:MAG: CADD family putative folate metabolism protein [Bacteriovoracia bacterium]
MLRIEKPLLQHPFYRDWMEGKLKWETLRNYAEQYYAHVEAFPSYLKSAIQLCPHVHTRAILEENLAEENGTTYGVAHPELWLRFAEGLGCSREVVMCARKRNAIQNVVSTFYRLTQGSLPKALGAIYAYEAQVPEVAASKIEGLRRHFRLLDERSLSFFEVHRHADVAHRQALGEILEGFSADERREAQEAADEAGQALWDFLTDAHEPPGQRSA